MPLKSVFFLSQYILRLDITRNILFITIHFKIGHHQEYPFTWNLLSNFMFIFYFIMHPCFNICVMQFSMFSKVFDFFLVWSAIASRKGPGITYVHQQLMKVINIWSFLKSITLFSECWSIYFILLLDFSFVVLFIFRQKKPIDVSRTQINSLQINWWLLLNIPQNCKGEKKYIISQIKFASKSI